MSEAALRIGMDRHDLAELVDRKAVTHRIRFTRRGRRRVFIPASEIIRLRGRVVARASTEVAQ